MTADLFAGLVQAQRTGAGRWKARCPAHADRTPSLSISEGQDGRVLLRCFAGCTVSEILAALGLGLRDLFAGPPPSPEQTAALRATQEVRLIAKEAERKARLDALNRLEKLQAVVNALGAKLARAPENDALAQLLHTACDRLQAAELQADSFYPMRRVSAQDKETILERSA